VCRCLVGCRRAADPAAAGRRLVPSSPLGLAQHAEGVLVRIRSPPKLEVSRQRISTRDPSRVQVNVHSDSACPRFPPRSPPFPEAAVRIRSKNRRTPSGTLARARWVRPVEVRPHRGVVGRAVGHVLDDTVRVMRVPGLQRLRAALPRSRLDPGHRSLSEESPVPTALSYPAREATCSPTSSRSAASSQPKRAPFATVGFPWLADLRPLDAARGLNK
jgi:hypothetical protein